MLLAGSILASGKNAAQTGLDIRPHHETGPEPTRRDLHRPAVLFCLQGIGLPAAEGAWSDYLACLYRRQGR